MKYNCSQKMRGAGHLPEAYSEPCQTSTMKRFAGTFNGFFYSLPIFAKRFILDV